MIGNLIKPVSKGRLGEDLEILRSVLIHALHRFRINEERDPWIPKVCNLQFFLHYNVVRVLPWRSRLLEIVSYSWYQSQPWIRTQNIRIWRKIFGFSGKSKHSVQFRGFSIHPKLNIFTYLESTRRDDHNGGWHVAGNRRTRPHAPHAPPRARRTAARQIHAPKPVLTGR